MHSAGLSRDPHPFGAPHPQARAARLCGLVCHTDTRHAPEARVATCSLTYITIGAIGHSDSDPLDAAARNTPTVHMLCEHTVHHRHFVL